MSYPASWHSTNPVSDVDSLAVFPLSVCSTPCWGFGPSDDDIFDLSGKKPAEPVAVVKPALPACLDPNDPFAASDVDWSSLAGGGQNNDAAPARAAAAAAPSVEIVTKTDATGRGVAGWPRQRDRPASGL